MNQISLNGKAYTGPSTWAEMTQQQLVIWNRILAKEITLDDAIKLCIVAFYNIPKRTFFKLNPVQRFALGQTLMFLHDGNRLVKWVTPTLRIRFKKFYGPESRLSTSTIKEFRSTEFYYNAYRRSLDEKYLDMLIAALYRPKDKAPAGNDIREMFTDIKVRSNAGMMSKINPDTRQLILFNYEGCRAFVAKKYPEIFKTGTAESNAIPDLEPLINIVAGGKFGTFRETESTGLYQFLDHLKGEIEDAEKKKS